MRLVSCYRCRAKPAYLFSSKSCFTAEKDHVGSRGGGGQPEKKRRPFSQLGPTPRRERFVGFENHSSMNLLLTCFFVRGPALYVPHTALCPTIRKGPGVPISVPSVAFIY